MGRPYSRDYESELMDKMAENGVTDTMLVQEMLGYFSSDDTCAFLESVCDDFDIEY